MPTRRSKPDPTDSPEESSAEQEPQGPTERETELATELAAANAKIATLEAELTATKQNRDGVTGERAAMWRDYCRLRDVLVKAFPEIPDPDAKSRVGAALAAGPSH